MKRFVTLTIFLAALASLAFADGLDAYLKLRRQHKISQAVGVEALETLVGTRVVEVKGVVKGSFRVGTMGSILVERSDGETLLVDSPNIPEWLTGAEVPARLLVKASRNGEDEPLRAALLGVAPEQPIAKMERAEADRVAAAAKKAARSAITSASRGTVKRDWSLPPNEVVPIYAAFIKGQNRRLSDAESVRIAQGVVGFSMKYGVDARLIMAMVMVESGFNPAATSRAGAQGLGQLMPGTAKWMGVTDAYDSIDNLYGTVKLVRTHLDKYRAKTGKDFESLVLTLAAYNAGEGAVRRHGGIPPYRETQAYVRKVIGLYGRLSGGA